MRHTEYYIALCVTLVDSAHIFTTPLPDPRDL